jgi:hypothetical protein
MREPLVSRGVRYASCNVICCSCRWGNTMSLNCGHQRACSSPWHISMESHRRMILTGENRRTRIKTCPSAPLSITNPTWTDPGANPSLRDERPVTNRLSHDTALTGGLGAPLTSETKMRFPALLAPFLTLLSCFVRREVWHATCLWGSQFKTSGVQGLNPEPTFLC